MSYSIIQPPFTLKFREMSKSELRRYYEWFMAVHPTRIQQLDATVSATASAAPPWQADYSPDSLRNLGDWFAQQVETRARRQDEIEEVRSQLLFPIEIPSVDLTNRSFSLAMDVGMYFGEVVARSVPGARWAQLLTSTKHADYGQPVLVGLGAVPLNPVRIAVSLAYGIANGKESGARLRELYDRWLGMRPP